MDSMSEIDIKRGIYLDLLGEFGLTELKHAGNSYKEAYDKMVEYVNDQLAALEVAEKLSETVKQYTMDDNYSDIAKTAKELGIRYVGKAKQQLLEEVNKHVI